MLYSSADFVRIIPERLSNRRNVCLHIFTEYTEGHQCFTDDVTLGTRNVTYCDTKYSPLSKLLVSGSSFMTRSCVIVMQLTQQSESEFCLSTYLLLKTIFPVVVFTSYFWKQQQRKKHQARRHLANAIETPESLQKPLHTAVIVLEKDNTSLNYPTLNSRSLKTVSSIDVYLNSDDCILHYSPMCFLNFFCILFVQFYFLFCVIDFMFYYCTQYCNSVRMTCSIKMLLILSYLRLFARCNCIYIATAVFMPRLLHPSRCSENMKFSPRFVKFCERCYCPERRKIISGANNGDWIMDVSSGISSPAAAAAVLSTDLPDVKRFDAAWILWLSVPDASRQRCVDLQISDPLVRTFHAQPGVSRPHGFVSITPDIPSILGRPDQRM